MLSWDFLGKSGEKVGILETRNKIVKLVILINATVDIFYPLNNLT